MRYLIVYDNLEEATEKYEERLQEKRAAISKLNTKLAKTQAQLKEAREALLEISHGDDTAPEIMRRIAKNVLSRPADYSALDAAIEPYRLDAERWRVLLEHVGNAPVPPKGKFYISISPSANFTSKPAEDLTAGIDAAIARKG